MPLNRGEYVVGVHEGILGGNGMRTMPDESQG